LRNPSVRQGRGPGRRLQALGDHPVGRPRQRAGGRQPAHRDQAVRPGRADAVRLLRRAAAVRRAGRQGRGRPRRRIRPRRADHRQAKPAVPGPGRGRRTGNRVDEPRRPRHRHPGRLRGDRHLDGRALRRHRQRRPQDLRRAVPPRGGPHRQRRQDLQELPVQHRRPEGRLDHGGLPPGDGPEDPRPGRRRQGDLRPVGRRRQLGGRRPDPRGDRRPADLRLRRHRSAAQERGRAGRDPVPRPLQHPADPRGRRRPVPGRPSRS